MIFCHNSCHISSLHITTFLLLTAQKSVDILNPTCYYKAITDCEAHHESNRLQPAKRVVFKF